MLTSAALGLALGCGTGNGERAFTVRDSSGIRIRESTAPLWGDETRWQVTPEPEVAIGQAEGDPGYLLAEVRGARRLSDGRIVVVDAGTSMLRVYDSDGRHSHDIGGEGEGPGEFQRLHALHVIGDTLIAYELWPPAVTWFTADGTLLRTSRIPNPAGDDGWRNLLPYGFLERHGVVISTSDATAAEFVDGVNRLPRALWRFAVDGSSAERLGSIPGPETYLERLESGGVRMTMYPFYKHADLAVASDRIYLGSTEAYAIRLLDEEGRLRSIVRRQHTSRAVGAGEFDAWVECRLAWLDPPPEDRERAVASTRSLEHASTVPAFRSLVADSEGNLWVEEFDTCVHRQGTFSIFNLEGRWLGSVELPPGVAREAPGPYEPWLEIGPDYVLGVWRSELDVDQVRLYRIRKAKS